MLEIVQKKPEDDASKKIEARCNKLNTGINDSIMAA
jgi:hypothetical protein